MQLLSDGSNLYWALAEGILQVPSAGGPIVTLAPAADQACLAIDDANVYWTEASATGSNVLSVPKGGGQVQTLASADGSTVIVPFAIEVDETSVYWLDGALFKVAKGGGAVTTLLGGSGLSGDAGFLDRGCESLLIEGSSALLFDMIGATNELVRIPSTGQVPPTPLTAAESFLLVADMGQAFWISSQPSLTIDSVSIDGGSPTTVVSPVAMNINGLAISNGTLYWTTGAQVQSLKAR
jgi:hypothetical protein